MTVVEIAFDLMNQNVAAPAGVDGRICARHGTSVKTRLTVIDKVLALDPAFLLPSRGVAPDVGRLMDWVSSHVPPRSPIVANLPLAASTSANAVLQAPVSAFTSRKLLEAAQEAVGEELGFYGGCCAGGRYVPL